MARLLLCPAALSLALFTFSEFVAYNGEHLTILLWMLAAYLGVRAFVAGSSQAMQGFGIAAGLVIGSIPYAKLQGAPCAAILILMIAGALMWRVRSHGVRAALRAAAPGLLCTLVPTVFVIVYLQATRMLPYVLHSYLLWNLQYASGAFQFKDHADIDTPLTAILWPFRYLRVDAFGGSCVLSVVIGGLAVALLRLRRRGEARPGSGARITSGLVMALMAYYAVCKSGHFFGHYLLLLLFPLFFLNGVIWDRMIVKSYRDSSPRIGQRALAIFLAIDIAIPFAVGLHKRWRICGDTADPSLTREKALLPAHKERPGDGPAVGNILLVSRELKRLSRPGDRLVVWGWEPAYHAITGLPQGTRDSILPRIHDTEGHTDPYFLRAYIEDLDRNRPALFVDEVGPRSWIYHNRAGAAHEAFPQIDERIRRNYDFVEEIGSVRIYRRKDLGNRR